MAQLDPALLSRFLTDQAWKRLGEALKLSARELQICRAIFCDDKELAIARRLGISVHTAHTYLQRIYVKLSVHSRVELIAFLLGTFLSMTAAADSSLPSICGRRTSGTCPFFPEPVP